MSYGQVKTWHEQFLDGSPSRRERLNALRQIVRDGSGERGLRRVFGSFEGARSIDPTIPGVEQTARMLRSASKSQAKGYKRELLYAVALHNSKDYRLVEMNRPLVRRWGNTDADIVFRSRRTGLFGRIEVKDFSLDSQTTNATKLMRQMDKMAREARLTGHRQYWMNRRPVTAALKRYADQRGIVVLENVATGRRRHPGTQSFEAALRKIDRDFAQVAKRRGLAGGTQLAFGLWLAANSAPSAWQALADVSADNSGAAWRRLGEQGAYTIAGTGMAMAGASMLFSPHVREAWGSRLYRMGRFGGIASAGALLAGQAFFITRYRSGDINSREFWTQQWVMNGQAFGSFAGAWLGRGAGLLIGKHPFFATAGGALGGVAGGGVGQKFSAWGVERYYDWRFGELDEAFGRAVYRQYGLI